MDLLGTMRVTGHLPAEGARGRARMGRWRVGAEEARTALRLQRLFSPGAEGHPLPLGDHTVLVVDERFCMCDAPFVLRNYVPFLATAAGDVLLAGLGLGCLVRGLLGRPRVRSVTVLELHADVIALVGPHHDDPRLEVVHADALRWRPAAGRAFDTAMLDIGDDRGLLERLVARHAEWAAELWPDPQGIPDGPLAPDVRHLVEAAAAAVPGGPAGGG